MNDLSVPLPPPQIPKGDRSLFIALPMLTLSWLVLVAIAAMAVVRIPRYELAPGEAMEVASRISFEPLQDGGAVPNRYVADNGIKFVTAFGGQVTLLDSILGWIDPYVQVNTYKEQFGESTPANRQRVGFQSMLGAKQVAEYVAMKKIGLKPELVMGAVVVAELICDGKPKTFAACDVLAVGDTITKFDGKPTPLLTDLRPAMDGRVGGDVVTLTVVPYSAPGKKTKKEVIRKVTLMTSPDEPKRTIIGISPADTRTVELPFNVGISTTDIGGPSAGLAFTLALIDELTKGELLGKTRVATTGTMSPDGTVGAIGALVQKSVAVRDSGATLFMVPAGQTNEEVTAARKAAGPKVKIVQVATLDEALTVLRKNGGDPLPAITATTIPTTAQ